jgi:hypothetical protein
MEFQKYILRSAVVYLFAGSFGILGCIKSTPLCDPKNPIVHVAVLPLHNMTIDVDGCTRVRRAFNKMVADMHYSTESLERIDQILSGSFGITLGGQLDISNVSVGAPSPQSVGTALGVDGLFYGTLVEFDDRMLFFYEEKRINVKFSLVSVKTGLIVWEREEEVYYNNYKWMMQSVNPDQVTNLDDYISEMQQIMRSMNPFDKMYSLLSGKKSLQDETDEVMKKLQKTLPPGPRCFWR